MDGGVDVVEHCQPELLAMALGDVAVLVLVCLHVTEDPGDAASGLGILSGKEGNASAEGRDVTFGTVVLGWGPAVLLQKSLHLSRGMSFLLRGGEAQGRIAAAGVCRAKGEDREAIVDFLVALPEAKEADVSGEALERCPDSGLALYMELEADGCLREV